MIENIETRIATNEDIDKMSIKEGQKMNNIVLDFKGETIDKTKFMDLFNRLQKVKGLQKVELDLTKFPLDTEQVDLVNKFFKNLDDLKEIYVHVSETKFDDSLFDRLLNESLSGKKSIEKIHLVMENVNMCDTKRRSIEKLVNSLPSLRNVHINMQRNNMTKEDLADLHRLIFHYPHRVLLW
jgi:predicted RNA binding protein with dsRBD fold (UPF0201 family)